MSRIYRAPSIKPVTERFTILKRSLKAKHETNKTAQIDSNQNTSKKIKIICKQVPTPASQCGKNKIYQGTKDTKI